ncbi:glycosyltransferase [Marinobacter sp. UBA2498]|jgi:glycosyltransferase involved in cell wall biosynthesis|uniref:glycosyltransferase n=1 Tax=Marinobacter sp. UBA2498 TaxID=1946813 RepID=UPI000C94DDE7|nr:MULTISPECIES: glycosyltransferase [unclassified Marinobacter]MAK48882.1 glycosyl transferase [Marinobacter sp.]|tara:strand:+ start:24 stop:1007 length:984 start_codon:yes stop_codon:yes gene_type:complete
MGYSDVSGLARLSGHHNLIDGLKYFESWLKGIVVANENPLVSVITPTFNRSDFLPESIDSVLAQTYQNFQLIIVDDGSTDSTREVVEPYLTDQRIKYFYQSNQGQSVARNKGISESSGEFICFLDSDNAWLPNKLDRSLLEFSRFPQSDIVYGDGILIDEKSAEIGKNTMKRYSGRITHHLLKDNFVSMNTTMTRRKCFDELGSFNESDRVAEDYELWLRFSTRFEFRYIPEFLSYYRVMENQISSDKKKRFSSNERLLLKFLEQYPDAVTSRQRRQGLSHFYIRKARYEISIKSFRDSIYDIARGINYYPWWQGPWRALGKLLLKR